MSCAEIAASSTALDTASPGSVCQSITGKVARVDFADGKPVLAVQAHLEKADGTNELREFPVNLVDVTSIANSQSNATETSATDGS